MLYDTILTERDGHTGIIKLNRPLYQVIDYKLLDDLNNALSEMAGDTVVRTVILTATGDKFFSRGFDIASMLTDPMSPVIGPMGHMVFGRIEKFPKPVIAAINGIALGGGCEMAAACHLRVMVDRADAFIGQEEVKIGIIPGWGGSTRLPRLIGRPRALEMVLTYKKLSAREAFEWGLVNRVSRPGEIMKDALELARNINEAHSVPLKSLLDVMIRGAETNTAECVEIEQAASDACWETGETIKLLTTFVEKGEKTLEDEGYSFKWAVVE
jgi:enoyl-CoA hydratase/carnithine racemase